MPIVEQPKDQRNLEPEPPQPGADARKVAEERKRNRCNRPRFLDGRERGRIGHPLGRHAATPSEEAEADVDDLHRAEDRREVDAQLRLTDRREHMLGLHVCEYLDPTQRRLCVPPEISPELALRKTRELSGIRQEVSSIRGLSGHSPS